MSELKGQHLHFDCTSGAAGDMTLAALIDLGVPVEVIGDALDRVGIGAERLQVRRVIKHGISAIDVRVDVTPRPGQAGHSHEHHHHDDDHHHHHDDHHHHGHDHHHHGHDHHHHDEHSHDHHHHDEHSHSHDHHHGHSHEHRHYRDIKAMICDAPLAQDIIAKALDMFERVARAEAKLHGTSVEDVAFHEVGAIDSIVDIVGTAAALAWLAPGKVSAVSVAMGHGSLTCAHGVLPVPAPAALEILREAGAVMESGGLARELCTPTGAAILASAVTEWAPMPPLRPLAVGYGAGDADLADRANVIRVIVGRPVADSRSDMQPEPSATTLWRVEANIDDMSPEMCENAAQAAFSAGAVDVWWMPIVMKKGRPALLLSALAPADALDRVAETLLRETTTIGVRFDRVQRRVLDREVEYVITPYGELPIKIARLHDEVVNAAPEYEPCREAAKRHGVPLKQVYAAVVAAFGAKAAHV